MTYGAGRAYRGRRTGCHAGSDNKVMSMIGPKLKEEPAGQRIYDQRPVVGFLGVRLQTTWKTGYEKVELDCLECNRKEEGNETPGDAR